MASYYPSPIQQAFNTDPRVAYAEALRQQASVPTNNPFMGLSNALSKALAGYQEKKARDEYSQQATDYQKAVAEALTQYGSGDQQGAFATLYKNPYAGELAQQLQLSEIQMKRKADLEAERRRQEAADKAAQPLEVGGVLVQRNPDGSFTQVFDSRRQDEPKLYSGGDGSLYNPQSGQWIQNPNRKPEKPNLVNAGDGRIYNADSNTWITAPGGGSQFRAMTPEEVKKAGLPAGTSAQIGPNGKIDILTKPAEASGDKAPSGYRYKADGTLEAIPGGPGDIDKPQSIPAEMAARLALAESYVSQVPDIKAAINSGTTSGFGGSLALATNVGDAGIIKSRQESGVDALIRNLTGAGMSQSESEKYAKRYSFDVTDSKERQLEKVDQLAYELKNIDSTVLKLRGRAPSAAYSGINKPRNIAPTTPKAAKPAGAPKKIANDDDYNALPSGAEFIDPNGVRRRKP